MGAVGFVDLAAEGRAPRGVVQANVAVERHPVLDFGVVALTAQHGIARLVRQAVDAFWRGVAAVRVARDEVAFQDAFAIFVQPELLSIQADFDVARAPVFVGMDRCGLSVNRFADSTLFLC